jgi:hypothetical protein
MPNYEILATQAGPFRQKEVVTEKQIVDAGHSVEHWLSHNGIKETTAAPTNAPAKNPAPPAPPAGNRPTGQQTPPTPPAK